VGLIRREFKNLDIGEERKMICLRGGKVQRKGGRERRGAPNSWVKALEKKGAKEGGEEFKCRKHSNWMYLKIGDKE